MNLSVPGGWLQFYLTLAYVCGGMFIRHFRTDGSFFGGPAICGVVPVCWFWLLQCNALVQQTLGVWTVFFDSQINWVPSFRVQDSGNRIGETRGCCHVSCNNACKILETGCEVPGADLLLVSARSRVTDRSWILLIRT